MMEAYLRSAAAGNVDELLANLIEVKDVDIRDRQGCTALMLAARYGHLSLAKELLSRGCQPGLLSLAGHTAQDIAEFWQHKSIVRLLSSTTTTTSPSTTKQAPRPSNHLCNNPLDRSNHLRTNDQWMRRAKKHPDSIYIVFSDLSILSHNDEEPQSKGFTLARFNYEGVLKFADPDKLSVFLGVETSPSYTIPPNAPTEAGWFAVQTHLTSIQITDHQPSISILSCRNGFKELSTAEAAVAGMARSMLAWHQRSSFCSICGHATFITHAGFKRTCSNSQCPSTTQISNTCYPRVDPTVIMAISSPDNRRLLLGRSKTRHSTHMWSVLAGFIEPGESIEEAVRREVLEETKVLVGEVVYHSSQPWPQPSSLMVGCMGQALSEEIVIDEAELVAARWFGREELQQMVADTHPQDFIIPPDFSISHKLITQWLSRQEG